MTKAEAIEIIKRVDICANAVETARDMAIAALQNDTTTLEKSLVSLLRRTQGKAGTLGTKVCLY